MRLERITWKQAERYFKDHHTAVIPIGSIENHGSHLTLGTDFLIPSHLTGAIEKKCDVLIVPAVPYGVADHHFGFPGTISLGYDGLRLVLEKITDCLYRYGVRRFVFLNGHGGNDQAILDTALQLEDKGALGALLNWWQLAGELNPKWKGGHGGGEETAAILAIDPSLVHMEDYMPLEPQDISAGLPTSGVKTVRYQGIDVTVQRHFGSVTPSGWFGPDDPKDATEEPETVFEPAKSLFPPVSSGVPQGLDGRGPGAGGGGRAVCPLRGQPGLGLCRFGSAGFLCGPMGLASACVVEPDPDEKTAGEKCAFCFLGFWPGAYRAGRGAAHSLAGSDPCAGNATGMGAFVPQPPAGLGRWPTEWGRKGPFF